MLNPCSGYLTSVIVWQERRGVNSEFSDILDESTRTVDVDEFACYSRAKKICADSHVGEPATYRYCFALSFPCSPGYRFAATGAIWYEWVEGGFL